MSDERVRPQSPSKHLAALRKAEKQTATSDKQL
jgi:hypothetical protein